VAAFAEGKGRGNRRGIGIPLASLRTGLPMQHGLEAHAT